MAPTRPATGGRPKNAWTSSRHRKLVRLHTLTTLSKEEIGMVLSSNDFNPCVRDIGKKLAVLFPRDYGKNHHKYHPSKNNPSTKALMIQRFERLRKHQTRKPIASGQSSRARSRTDAPGNTSAASQDPFILFEGSISAFRDYGGYSHTLAYEDSSESRLIKPSSLLLDGSTVHARTTTAFESEVSTGPIMTAIEYQNVLNSSTPLLSAELATSKPPSPRSSISSLRALEQRLSCHSVSIIRHVHSILRYSSASSWTSTLSWRSSGLSFDSSMEALAPKGPALPTDEDTTSTTTPDTNISKSLLRKFFTRGVKHPPLLNLPLAEQCVWHELIDENQLAILPGRPAFTPPILTVPYRNLGKESIGVCGTLAVHIAAAKPKGRDILKLWPHQINSGDYFNNRPLHFAAIKFRGSDRIIKILKGGGDAALVNTSGETFVHILFGRVPLEYLLSDYLSLLKYLAAVNFDFSCRDYHGRTPLHMLLQEKMIFKQWELGILRELFQLLRPDLECVDNFGLSIRSYVLKKTREHIPRNLIDTVLSARQTIQHNIIDFRHLLKEASDDWEIYIKEVLAPGHISRFDKNGDTALIALLKWWNYDLDELLLEDAIRRMVARGAEVHMRNRAGDTALAIATRRGLRPAVTTLIDLGASIHTRNYQKIGILRQAQNCLAQAKHVEADKLYGMILSCIIFLVDLGATIDTHAYREWGASCVPLKDLDKAYSLYRQIRPEPITPQGFRTMETDWLS